MTAEALFATASLPRGRRRDRRLPIAWANLQGILLVAYILLFPITFVAGGSGPESEGLRLSAADLVFPGIVASLLLAKDVFPALSRYRTSIYLLLGASLVTIASAWLQSFDFLRGFSMYSLSKAISLSYLVVLAAVIVDVVRTERIWRFAFDALAVSGAISALVGIFGWVLYLRGIDTGLMDFNRANSTFWGDPNIYASLLAVALIFQIARASISRREQRWFWLGLAAVTLWALILSQSRSGLLGTAGGVAFFGLIFRPQLTLTWLGLAALIAVIAASAFFFAGAPAIPGVSDNSRFSSRTFVSRTEFWQKAADLIPEEGLKGIGPGSFKQVNEINDALEGGDVTKRSHNTYLSTVLELGLPGVVAILLLSVAIARNLAKLQRLAGAVRDPRVAAIAGALVAMLAFAFWVDALYQRHLWILIGLALCQHRLLRPEPAEPAVPHLPVIDSPAFAEDSNLTASGERDEICSVTSTT